MDRVPSYRLVSNQTKDEPNNRQVTPVKHTFSHPCQLLFLYFHYHLQFAHLPLRVECVIRSMWGYCPLEAVRFCNFGRKIIQFAEFLNNHQWDIKNHFSVNKCTSVWNQVIVATDLVYGWKICNENSQWNNICIVKIRVSWKLKKGFLNVPCYPFRQEINNTHTKHVAYRHASLFLFFVLISVSSAFRQFFLQAKDYWQFRHV